MPRAKVAPAPPAGAKKGKALRPKTQPTASAARSPKRTPPAAKPAPAPPVPANPTHQQYGALEAAFDHFNAQLFGGRLPKCLITLRAHGRSFGYFAGNRFSDVKNVGTTTDEIAMNPKPFLSRSATESLSTLAHEMTHVEQHHFGTPPRTGYHNREWGELMLRIGLQPSATGAAGGRMTGYQMNHYVIADGPFDVSCRSLLASGWELRLADTAKDAEWVRGPTRVKFTCPQCHCNAWGAASLKLLCGACGGRRMLAQRR
jgi:hypothetical protein